MRNEIFTPINDFPAYTIGNYGIIIPYLNTIIGTTEYYNIINTFADRYNVMAQTIKCIVWGKTWKSV